MLFFTFCNTICKYIWMPTSGTLLHSYKGSIVFMVWMGRLVNNSLICHSGQFCIGQVHTHTHVHMYLYIFEHIWMWDCILLCGWIYFVERCMIVFNFYRHAQLYEHVKLAFQQKNERLKFLYQLSIWICTSVKCQLLLIAYCVFWIIK